MLFYIFMLHACVSTSLRRFSLPRTGPNEFKRARQSFTRE